MEIGAHGFSHTRLPHLATERVREELSAARRALEAALGERVDLFGYPFNSLRRRHRALVREAGYAAAVAGVKHGNANRFSLYRAPVMRSTTPAQVVALLDGWH
jgi:peptidoglycan/xylan/chitin deacetylase (PgdA/CDA1 family)